jgi:hypothetical protein
VITGIGGGVVEVETVRLLVGGSLLYLPLVTK